MGITAEDARRELARRELVRRGVINESGQKIQRGSQDFQDESFLSKLPRNIFGGAANLGRDIHNLPHELAKQFEDIGQQFRQGLNIPGGNNLAKPGKPFSERLPNDTTNYPEVFGQKGSGTTMDNLIQKGIEYAPEIASGRALLRTLPLTKKLASIPYKKVEKIIEGRGIGKEVNIDKKLINEVKKHLPNTPEVKELINDARNGNYKDLFQLQSDVGQSARKVLDNPMSSFADRRRALEGQSLKKRMLKGIQGHYEKIGHKDVSEHLQKATNKYRQYHKLKKNVYPTLKKIGIPTSGVAAGLIGYEKLKDLLR